MKLMRWFVSVNPINFILLLITCEEMVKIQTTSAGEKHFMALMPGASTGLKRHDKVLHKGRYKSYKGTVKVIL